ncbi:MAG: phosphoribosylaminoimidazolesuccinocarboxamide synthase [Candidatus Pacebacteria bacterium]|nr:phosphoribosylaminoimidazolesuccinocarboxamide synthase [Candidatus Paceibacterota bacterium]
MSNVSSLTILKEGKTKKILTSPDLSIKGLAVVESKDDITAENGKKHDVIVGKGVLSNTTTCNVFRLLKECNIPVAFKEKLSENEFLAEKCEMLPYEVVVRREAHGSFLKRHPFLKKGHVFPRLKTEFFLKTSQKKWNEHYLLADDPLAMINQNNEMDLFIPNEPVYEQKPFLTLSNYPLKGEPGLFSDMDYTAKQVFLILEKAWQLIGKRLVDFKLEFGFNRKGEILLADVIDNDSWRLLDSDHYLDKQVYRDNGQLNQVTKNYKFVAEATKSFGIPNQQVILWRASSKDNLDEIVDGLKYYGITNIQFVTKSIHKEPGSVQMLHSLIQEVPSSMLIVLCGRSNGAGPTLSAQCVVPTITVPASYRDFPDDVWSSLRTPSNVPSLMVLEQKNAAMAAAQILALQNPLIYSLIKIDQERHLYNFVEI